MFVAQGKEKNTFFNININVDMHTFNSIKENTFVFPWSKSSCESAAMLRSTYFTFLLSYNITQTDNLHFMRVALIEYDQSKH